MIKRLQDDVLLLRFFCEAYGARNKPEGYQQPRISSIQRDEIFDIYLNHKLEAMGDADALAGEAGSRQVAPGKTVSEVLSICLQYMLDNWQFDNVPVKIIPTHLTLALERLLEEELIVRRDAPGTAGFFSPTDETLNFTFDEFRDFLLAQYLVQNVFASDKKRFGQYISNQPHRCTDDRGSQAFLVLYRKEARRLRISRFLQSTTLVQRCLSRGGVQSSE